MSLLEQSRAIAHVQGIPPGAPSQLLSPHPLDSSAPNPDVLLALLTRNKALEGMSVISTKCYHYCGRRMRNCGIYIATILGTLAGQMSVMELVVLAILYLGSVVTYHYHWNVRCTSCQLMDCSLRKMSSGSPTVKAKVLAMVHIQKVKV